MALQYIGSIISGLASDTKPTSRTAEKGALFVTTDTNKIYQWDGDSWNETTASDASTSSKGVASFNSTDFSVSSGAVSLAASPTVTNLVIGDAGNIGSASDTDAIAIASGGAVTFSQRSVHSGGITVADDGQIGSSSDTDAIAISSAGVVTFSGSIDISGANGLKLSNDETITNGTDGQVDISGNVQIGSGSGNATFKSSGNHNIIIQTGNSTTGSITITDGANGNIDITPNGTGETNVTNPDLVVGSDADGDLYYRASSKLARLAKGTAGQTLQMNAGATAPEWATAGGGGLSYPLVMALG